MYAYVDETVNTGENLLDGAQPVLVTAAVMSRKDLDVAYQARVGRLSESVDEPILHANKLGPEKIEKIVSGLLAVAP